MNVVLVQYYGIFKFGLIKKISVVPEEGSFGQPKYSPHIYTIYMDVLSVFPEKDFTSFYSKPLRSLV